MKVGQERTEEHRCLTRPPGGLLESRRDFRNLPGLLPGAWEAAREDKAPGSGDRQSFRPREGVLLTSPRKQRAVVSPLRPRHLPLLA